MFIEKFKMTGAIDLAEPKFKRFTDSYPWKEMSSGLYNPDPQIEIVKTQEALVL